MSNVIVSPEYEALKKEIEALRKELAKNLLDLDELEFVICKNIETRYMLELGDLEYKVFKAECEYRRLKRKLEMIQAKVNYQEKVDIRLIDEVLDIEFGKYKEMLEERMDRINEAICRNGYRALTDAETIELKSMYRSIVRKLHPDINPDVSDEQLKLFYSAVNAYKNGDLKGLKLVYRMIEDDEYDPDAYRSIEDYQIIKEQLEDSIDAARERVDLIKSRFPYTAKDMLDDPNAIEERRSEFSEKLNEYEKGKTLLSQRIDDLFKDINNGGYAKWVS